MTETWRILALTLWGENFARPMADVLGVHKKTVERWKLGHVVPPDPAYLEGRLRELIDLMPRTPRVIGEVAAREARGEEFWAIRRDYLTHRDAVDLLENHLRFGVASRCACDVVS